MNLSIDGGWEWRTTTEKSFDQAVKKFHQPLDLKLALIRKGHPEDNPYVERSHRTDNEELYVPYGLNLWIKIYQPKNVLKDNPVIDRILRY